MPSSSTHIILLAHGSREQQWLQTFEDGLEILHGRLSQPASVAFMELAKPSLQEAVNEKVEHGVSKFRIIPMFFAAGKHLQEDIPRIINTLIDANPNIEILLEQELGKDRAFWEFLANKIDEETSSD